MSDNTRDNPQRGVRIAILGDLHYETNELNSFETAREQILYFEPDALVSLGDLGGYSHCGTKLSFQEAYDYFSTFKKPFYPLLGNHDLEGEEFQSDKESISFWCKTFGLDSPYYAVDLGHSILIFLSATGHRENRGSCHEVHIDEDQIKWFEEAVEGNKQTPIFVFSHCPIFGSNIRVLQNLHLKIPNAYLNHFDSPDRFINIVKKNPQVKLWFSGHNHLGQLYSDSITKVGTCTFVHTGVISSISRDGNHHSRYLEFGERGFVLSTLDHDKNQCQVDVLHEYNENEWERYTKIKSMITDKFFTPPPFPENPDFEIDKSVFLFHQNMLVEYDKELQSALGIVLDKIEPGKLEVERGQVYFHQGDHQKILLPKNKDGWFYKVFLKNPHLSKKKI